MKKIVRGIIGVSMFLTPLLSMAEGSKETPVAFTEQSMTIFDEDFRILFGEDVVTESNQPMELRILTDAEMEETEGTALLPLVLRIGSTMLKFAHHGPHHKFRWIGKQPHFQLIKWTVGVKGSYKTLLRIPTKFWRGK